MRGSWLGALLVISGCFVGVSDAPPDPDVDPPPDPQPTTPTIASIAGGSFSPIAPYTNIAGRALMVRRLDGNTDLSMAITGVTPGTGYTAHLHAAPCQYAGGGHYKIDPAIVGVVG
jgi:hypothetical protein